jgi:hypothetical protein
MLALERDNRGLLNTSLNNLREEYRQKAMKFIGVKDPANVTSNLGIKDPVKKKAADDGLDAFNKFVSAKVASGAVTVKSKGRGRASYGVQMNFTSGSGPSIFVHEMGHWLEANNPNVLTSALSFLAKRTAGEPAMRLSVITGNRGYRSYEVAKKDKFVNPYMGKIYTQQATEVVSMGLQMFYESPGLLAKQDPGYFTFIFNLVRGE